MTNVPPGALANHDSRVLLKGKSTNEIRTEEPSLRPEQLQLCFMLSTVDAHQLMTIVSAEEDRYHKYTQRVRKQLQQPHKRSDSKLPGDGDGGITSLLSQLLKHSLPMLDSTSEPVQKVGVAALHALVRA